MNRHSPHALPEQKALLQALSVSPSAASDSWRRLEISLPAERVLNWFEAQSADFRVAWRDRERDQFCLAWGLAQTFQTDHVAEIPRCLACLQHLLSRSAPGLRAWGGRGFGAGPNASQWSEMPLLRLVIPRFEITVTATEARLALNYLHPDEARHAIASLRPPVAQLRTELPLLWAPEHFPTESAWQGQVKQVLAAIAAGEFQKLVLARESRFRLSQSLSMGALVHRLLQQPDPAYLYCFQWPDQTLFAGLSPERLYRRQGTQVCSEALAGTRRTSADPTRQERLRTELLSSTKDRHEHQLVSDFIARVLTPLCAEPPRATSVQLRTSGPVQHLFQALEGLLQPDSDDASLLAALHPTPAVAGLPRPLALQALQRIQALSRGWYSSPVGWIAHDRAEFAVALRCLRARGQELGFFSGAGIVAGSQPAAEWAELNAKLETLLRLFPRQESHTRSCSPESRSVRLETGLQLRS